MRQIFLTFLVVATAGLFLAVECRNTKSVLQHIHRNHKAGNHPCTRGPAYWCQNLKTSSECDITSWCIEKKWTNMHAESDNSKVCETCKDAMTEARINLNNNAAQKDMETFLPHELNLVFQNYPDFEKILSSPIDTTVVCTVVGLCSSADINNSTQQHNST